MNKTYVALDIETTGLSPERDAIIEVGAVKFEGHRIVKEWSTLVNPQRPIPYKILQLTGISQAEVDRAPNLRTVLAAVEDFVRDLPVIGHNVAFDLSFLQRNGHLNANPSIDTFELASILIPHASRYSLSMLTGELGITIRNAHRALHDARATKDLFLALMDRATEMDIQAVQEINRAAARTNWPLKAIFKEVERAQSHQAWGGGSIGQQLRDKGVMDGQGFTGMFRQEPEQPLRPLATRRPVDVDLLCALLEPNGAIEREFPGFEHRPQQVRMLRGVADAFNDQQHIMVEAGTGTGKSWAYLLPAMHFAQANGEHVVVSTNTINLQDQLFKKDIPALQQFVPGECRAALLKGRSNYLCLHRLGSFRRRTDLSSLELTVLAKLLAWLPTTVTGDQAELFLPDPRQRAVWSQLNASAETCIADQCEHRAQGRCFFYHARERAESAHVIVVNHALLLADVAVEGRALPEYRYLIVDEAHNLESTTTNQLTHVLRGKSVEELVMDLGARGRGQRTSGLLADLAVRARRGLPPNYIREVDTHIEQIQTDAERVVVSAHEMFDVMSAFIRDHCEEREQQNNYGVKLRLTSALRKQPAWSEVEIAADNLRVRATQVRSHLDRLRNGLTELDPDVPDLARLIEEVAIHARRWSELLDSLHDMISEPRGESVYWAEISAESRELSVHSAPLHVGELIRQHLLGPKKSVVMTSATLTADTQFDFIQERLGAQEMHTLAVGSPFDYERSTLLYIPTDVPEPKQPYHQRAVEDVIRNVSLALGGRTMALFTSYAQLRTTARAISSTLANQEIIVYEQGDGMSRHQLLESFKSSPRAVLLGTRSFWEGVDIPGESLSCLILVRLPFSVPTDPIVAARSETFEDAFREYSLPDAILRFRQGFGRLIRSKTDRGIVVVLDCRILNKSYGQSFLDSLPACCVRKAPAANLPDEARRWMEGAN